MEDKKQILIIQGGMGISGISKSLISLLHCFDYNKYDIDLFVARPDGALYKLIPGSVNLINNHRPDRYSYDLKTGLKSFATLNIKKGFECFIRLALHFLRKDWGARYIASKLPRLTKEYDIIIDWQGQQFLYYSIDYLKAKTKISFFHSDYEKYPYYYRSDKKYYPKANHICTISETCVESLKRYFPSCSNKIHLIENIISSNLIEQMANTPIEMFSNEKPSFVTIGHISTPKGSDLAIDAALKLHKKGIDFTWYFIGFILEKKYVDIVLKNGLENKIKFLGQISNPYPYIKNATICVHTSRFEGKSVALDEMKLLKKPIVVTNFSTVYDQFQNRFNATISDMNSDSIANAIEELLTDNHLMASYIDNLKKTNSDNSYMINKLYDLFV